MNNEFARLGQLIFDLHAGKQFDLSEEENFIFLEEEYKRITIQLGGVCHYKALGWTYALDFHAAEGQRLLTKLRIVKDGDDLHGMDEFERERLTKAYKNLFMGLTELIRRIDILRLGKGVNLDDVN